MVQGVSFDEDGCTAEVEAFGVYAVVNSVSTIPEVRSPCVELEVNAT